MDLTSANVAELVTAARNGDSRALQRLIADHLPLVYNLVSAAMEDPAEVDDVVQDTMLRAVRELPGLRTPGSFRAWLAVIAVRQVGTHRQQRLAAGRRIRPLEEAAGQADPQAELEEVTALRSRLSGQRRQVAEATRWLDPDDQRLLSLWWQEVAGRLTRAELAEAAGITVAHAGVRVQRTREQLDLARAVVAALAARPLCSRLAAETADWDGRPSPLWRKRIARHVRGCRTCTAATEGLLPADKLLENLPALVVPAGLAHAVLGPISAGAGAAATGAAATGAAAAGATAAGATAAGAVTASVTGTAGASAVAGKVIAGIVAGVAAVAVTVPLVRPDDPAPGPGGPGVIAAPAPTTSPARFSTPAPTPSRTTQRPSAPPTAVPLGALSLEWAGGGYLSLGVNTDAVAVAAVDRGSGAENRRRATFTAVTGLADPRCFSFRAGDGRYLRHYELRGYVAPLDDSQIFREDATYCPLPGPVAGSVALQSFNYREFRLRWTGSVFGIGYLKDTAEFRTASSFFVRPALATG
ncbi:sigma-70 family RNA polymerase sigma factor [Actinoplanes sp. NPDC048796]|uniref:sigma-70 family RNA polymerase sigma factor n=1 Tax=Actinoplanes sp. NPDC048796 TaxID=3155640 RepID=UPI0033CF992D